MASDDSAVVWSAEGRSRSVIVIAADGLLREKSGQRSRPTCSRESGL